MGQKPGRRHGLGDQLRGQGGNLYRRSFTLNAFAALAGVFVADVADHLDFGRNDVQLLADLLPDTAERSSAGALFLRLGKIVDDLDARQIRRQRLSAGFPPLMGSNRDRLGVLRAAAFLAHLAIGLIKEPLLPLILRRQALFGFAAEDLVSQQPNLFFQVMELILVTTAQRGDDLLEFGGVIREAVNIQKHACRIAKA